MADTYLLNTIDKYINVNYSEKENFRGFLLSFLQTRKICTNLWHILAEIKTIIEYYTNNSNFIKANNHNKLYINKNCDIDDDTYIGNGCIIENFVTIKKNVIIGDNTIIRSGAYIRENCIIGRNCLIGNSSEIKNSVISDGCQIPHFNYVGDSILGKKVHLGAGVILSNLRLDQKNIIVKIDEKEIDTGIRKFGALIGENSEIGCNSVLNPGSIIGANCLVYPNTNLSGILLDNCIAKNNNRYSIIKKNK